MAKKNDITESLLYHDQQMRKIHSKYEEITSHLKANIMLV